MTCADIRIKTDEDLDSFDFLNIKTHQIIWIVSGICAVVCFFMSGWLMVRPSTNFGLALISQFKHMLNYRRPEQQRHILRIILMCPIYALCSFLSIRFLEYSTYFDAARSCYEAFVIYSFYALLLNYLGPDYTAQKAAMQRKPDGRYPFPFHYYFYNPRSGDFLRSCTRGTLQYALIHPITSLIQVILESKHLLCINELGPTYPMFYLLTIEMVSVTVAMYYLVLFYTVVHEDIRRFRPLAKFIAIKFVIFFSFWQAVFLSMIANWGWIEENDYFTVSSISSQIQNLLIGFEMIIACFMHERCFNANEYEGRRTNMKQGIRDIMMPVDLISETKKVMSTRSKKSKSNGAGNQAANGTANQIEMGQIKHGSQKKKSKKKSKRNSLTRQPIIPEESEPEDSYDDSDEDLHGVNSDERMNGGEAPLMLQQQNAIDGDLGDLNNMNLLKRTDSEDTNPDMEQDEIDDELEGVGIIRLNPYLKNINIPSAEAEDDEDGKPRNAKIQK